MAQNLYFSEADLGKKRRIQEDSHFAAEPENPDSPISTILLVADGMGGHEAGEIASAIARDIIENFFVKGKYKAFANKFGISLNKNPANYLKEILRETIFYIHNQIKSKAGSRSMGTTLTTALILKSDTVTKHVIIGHVGDSRAYILNENRAEQVTEDDSAVWKLYQSGKVSKDSLRTIKGNNVITQALGGESMDRPHIYKSTLKSNEVLLLSSDGLHGLISDKKILNIVRSSNNARYMADELIAAANKAGGKDNISVALYSERFKEKKKGGEHRTLNKILAVAASIVFLLGIAVLLKFVVLHDKSVKPGEDDEEIVIKMDEPKEVPANKGDKFSVIINDKFYWDPGSNNLIIKIIDSTASNFDNYEIELNIPNSNTPIYTLKKFKSNQIISSENINNGNGVKVIQELNLNDPGKRESTLTVRRLDDGATVEREFTIITNKKPGRDIVEDKVVDPDNNKDSNEISIDSTDVTVDITEEEIKVNVTKIDTLPPLPEGIIVSRMPMGDSDDTVSVKITLPDLIPFKIDKGGFKVGNGKLTNQGKMLKAHYIKYGIDSVPPTIQLKISGYSNGLRTYYVQEAKQSN